MPTVENNQKECGLSTPSFIIYYVRSFFAVENNNVLDL